MVLLMVWSLLMFRMKLNEGATPNQIDKLTQEIQMLNALIELTHPVPGTATVTGTGNRGTLPTSRNWSTYQQRSPTVTSPVPVAGTVILIVAVAVAMVVLALLLLLF
jgi:hypothetical protein